MPVDLRKVLPGETAVPTLTPSSSRLPPGCADGCRVTVTSDSEDPMLLVVDAARLSMWPHQEPCRAVRFPVSVSVLIARAGEGWKGPTHTHPEHSASPRWGPGQPT
jgi:hypothetical protein